ncbi:glycosyltransferase involved in cell wall biosynthesis [Mucilaginibacter sp. OAE612]|uniref:glycosyltransferase family 2 protein n=1 Tax=Mucilaginibacter sp. OAE612 TaxID=3156444 RepID=UPI00359ED398
MISVIIPCHNAARFVERAIRSVLVQSYKHIEIILVNNNSTDNTLQILERYAASYPGKVWVLDEKKPGAPAARNTGLKKARGEWIQYLDADDELMPSKLSHQFNITALHPEAGVIAGGCILNYYNTGNPEEIIRTVDHHIWRGLINSNLGITSSNLWNRAALNDAGGWDENITSSQEYDLLFRLLKNGVVIITDPGVNTIIHFSDNSISKSKDKEKIKRILDNRINFRIRIRTELKSIGMLTAELEECIDNYIYMEIMRNYFDVPAYAKVLLKKFPYRIPFHRAALLKSKMQVKRLRTRIRNYIIR